MKVEKCLICQKKKAAPKTGGLCNPCHHEKKKNTRPIEHAYYQWRRNCKRRKIIFTVSLDYFREFCYQTDILHGRGRKSTSWHIDRIIDNLGYVEGNLQKLTNTENVQKEHERRRRLKVVVYDWQTKEGRMQESNLTKPIDYEVPF